MSDGAFLPLIGADFPVRVIPLLDAAKRNIDIVVYDWRWYEGQGQHPVQLFNMALVRAVRRGVMVRAVLNAPALLPTLQAVGIQARKLKDRRTLHTKMILIDGGTLVIGSHNFTRNAFGSNIETSVAVSIPEGVDRFARFFDTLYGL